MPKQIYISLFFTALLGCSTTDKISCGSINWHEIGRQAGRTGQTRPKVSDIEDLCSDQDDAVSLVNLGYEFGLSDYCTAPNAYTLGRLGLELPQHCPETNLTPLKESFERGQRYRELVEMSRALGGRLNAIEIQISKPSVTVTELVLLEGRKSHLKSQTEKINREILTLEE